MLRHEIKYSEVFSYKTSRICDLVCNTKFTSDATKMTIFNRIEENKRLAATWLYENPGSNFPIIRTKVG